MALKLSFPIGLFPTRVPPSHPEDIVRQVLEANAETLTKTITAGSMTVSIAPNGNGIEMLDAGSGVVRFVIGGRHDIVEEVRFSLDWGRRTLDLQMTEDPDEYARFDMRSE